MVVFKPRFAQRPEEMTPPTGVSDRLKREVRITAKGTVEVPPDGIISIRTPGGVDMVSSQVRRTKKQRRAPLVFLSFLRFRSPVNLLRPVLFW